MAQPCQRGDLLCFSHRLLHWGSTASFGLEHTHRAALSFSFADPIYAVAAFLSNFLPFPPIGLRLALVAGQMILYAAQSPLNKYQLALNNRIFALNQKYFNPIYADKVLTAAQTLKFMSRVKTSNPSRSKKALLKPSIYAAKSPDDAIDFEGFSTLFDEIELDTNVFPVALALVPAGLAKIALP
jgi:hypothetical protein